MDGRPWGMDTTDRPDAPVRSARTADAGTGSPAPPRRDRPAVVALLGALVLAAVVLTALRSPGGVQSSSDPGYPPVALPVLLVPAVLVLVLCLLLPAGEGTSAVRVRRLPRLRVETASLVTIALAFPVVAALVPRPEDYVLAKMLLFVAVPCTVLGVLRRRGGSSVDIGRPRVAAWVPLLPALLLGVLSAVGPFSPGSPSSWPPLAVVVVAATATAVSAGLGEELLYRRFLQTRLEALAGRVTGILLASLLFAVMHVATHLGATPLDTLAQAIALQGTTGIVLGVIWSRWRRLWVCVLAHVLVNGLGVALHLLGLLGPGL